MGSLEVYRACPPLLVLNDSGRSYPKKPTSKNLRHILSGRVVVTAKPNGTHLNPAGTVHGGLAATLLDSCMGLAIRSILEKGIGQTTLEFKISLVRPITPETALIKAEGVA
jgi:uncharacterized protein (TIGR00369 family)